MLYLPSLSFIELGEVVFYNIYDIRINGRLALTGFKVVDFPSIINMNQLVIHKDVFAQLCVVSLAPSLVLRSE